jgi:hypothetical protein
MTNFGKLVFGLIIVALLAGTVFLLNKKPAVKPSEVVNPISEVEKSIPVKNENVGVLGNAVDLVSFSIMPGSSVSGTMEAEGAVQGGYFFEGNLILRILSANKTILRTSYGTATTDWMTEGPVSFHATLNFTGLPPGPAYIQIHNDNASGLPENDKFILVPIVIN